MCVLMPDVLQIALYFLYIKYVVSDMCGLGMFYEWVVCLKRVRMNAWRFWPLDCTVLETQHKMILLSLSHILYSVYVSLYSSYYGYS